MKSKPFLIGTVIGIAILLINLDLLLFRQIKKQENRIQGQEEPKTEQQEPKNQAETQIKDRAITLVFVGDVSLAREINWQINQQGNANFPFEKTKDIISLADLAIGNLESPLYNDCPLTRSGMKFCGNPENAKGLNFAGFDLVNLSNNHIANYGQEGIKTTKTFLEQNQINWFGLDLTYFKTINDLEMAFLGFDDISTRVDEQQMINQIKAAKQKSNFIIINFHWGAEYQSQPNQRQKNLAKTAIDSGADLIIGHHPHVLQPIEKYKDRLIIYSLGNFVFDQTWSEETRIGAIALISISPDKTAILEIIPIRIFDGTTPELIHSPEKETIINKIINS